jgi:hypothetical protein
MSVDPSVETYPLLFAVVQQHVDYYRESGEYVSKAHILGDLRKDSQYGELMAEAGLDARHPNAVRTFRRLFWQVVRYYMNSGTGWWARSGGRNSSFFHTDWGTPEDCRDATNLRIRQREQDQTRLRQIVDITETKCGQFGWVFDPQYDDAGSLAAVEVWKAAA